MHSLLVTVIYKGKRDMFRCACLDVHPHIKAWLGDKKSEIYDTVIEFKRGVKIEDVLAIDLESCTEDDFREDEHLMSMIRRID